MEQELDVFSVGEDEDWSDTEINTEQFIPTDFDFKLKDVHLFRQIATHRCTSILVALLILTLLALSASVITLIYSVEKVDVVAKTVCVTPVQEEQQSQIAITREYQVKLDHHEWTERNAGVSSFLDIIASVSSLDLTNDDIVQYIHDEFRVKGDACHNKDFFRVRNFYQPEDLEYKTTLDIKKNGDTDFNKTYNYPLWPAEQLFTNNLATQKCEQDMHECYYKFSRETRVYFAEHTEFTKCADIVGPYPWAFSIKQTELIYETPQEADTVYWWLGKATGYLLDTTKYEMEFTLQYSSLAAAELQSRPPSQGEWSLRIFTMEDGLSQEFDELAVAEVETIWQTLLAMSTATQCF